MADQWPDDVRLSDIEHRFVCTACGKRGAPGLQLECKAGRDDGLSMKADVGLQVVPSFFNASFEILLRV
jgi:hypothetical protein